VIETRSELSELSATGLIVTTKLPTAYDVLAPDGSEVRLLATLPRGSMAHFHLHPGQVSRAIRHRTVEEIWYILQGDGEIWRSAGGQELITALAPGVCLTLPVGTEFQFRASASEAITILSITMPPWPGAEEAEPVTGRWLSTV